MKSTAELVERPVKCNRIQIFLTQRLENNYLPNLERSGNKFPIVPISVSTDMKALSTSSQPLPLCGNTKSASFQFVHKHAQTM